jgi:hypothetical protein
MALISLMIEAVRAFETLVKSFLSTQRYNLEDSHLQNQFCSAPCGGILCFLGANGQIAAIGTAFRISPLPVLIALEI